MEGLLQSLTGAVEDKKLCPGVLPLRMTAGAQCCNELEIAGLRGIDLCCVVLSLSFPADAQAEPDLASHPGACEGIWKALFQTLSVTRKLRPKN